MQSRLAHFKDISQEKTLLSLASRATMALDDDDDDDDDDGD
jgi:hypothetical protein